MIKVRKFTKQYTEDKDAARQLEEFCQIQDISKEQIVRIEFTEIRGIETAFIVWDNKF